MSNLDLKKQFNDLHLPVVTSSASCLVLVRSRATMQRAATIARGSLRSARQLETRARPNGARQLETRARRPTGARPLSAKASKYEIRAQPAPGVPFHVAIPVHNIDEAKAFYGGILGCEEGRSSTKWQDYAMHGHQVVVHWVGEDYRCQDYVNPVDGDEVPVPHYGLQMPTLEAWEAIVARVNAAKIPWVIEPTLRFEGEPGEQWTCFFKDPSGNNLEFKHMSNPEWLFAKYNVAEG